MTITRSQPSPYLRTVAKPSFKQRGIWGLILATLILLATSYQNTQADEPVVQGKIPLVELQRFTTVLEYIKNYYVKPMEDPILFESGIRGMLEGLDPHSAYFNVEEFAALKESTTGKFGGLGIELEPQDGLIRIISPIDDTPAQRAGLQPGDLIIRIDDTPVKGLSARQSVEMMRGEKGSAVVLTILRHGENKPLVVKLIRDTISTLSVRSRLLEDNYGYVRVSQFQSSSGDNLVKAVQNLKKAAKPALQGLVLDLRNNPGGVLDASVQIADVFLDKNKLQYDNLIVYTKGRLPGSQIKEKAHAGDMLNGAPIVVLVNGGSASASEIVAGALQDHRRAIIMGTKTFGKGSVQTIFPLKDKRGLKLTTALYYTPAGRSIQATGITPDILVERLQLPVVTSNSNAEKNPFSIREEDLQGHLENGSGKNPEKALQVVPSAGTAIAPLANTDYQLYEALNLLKGLNLLQSDAAA